MGNTIAQQIEQQQRENKQKAEDLLNSMVTLGNTKKDIFDNYLISNYNDKTIPIDAIIQKYSKISCAIQKDSSKLVGQIGDILSKFCDGDIVNGVVKTMSLALDALFGNISSNASEEQGYQIWIKGLAILKFDYYCYIYQYNDESLMTICTNVLVYCYSISSVNFKEINMSTLIAIASLTYPDEKSQEEVVTKIIKIYGITGQDSFRLPHKNFRIFNKKPNNIEINAKLIANFDWNIKDIDGNWHSCLANKYYNFDFNEKIEFKLESVLYVYSSGIIDYNVYTLSSENKNSLTLVPKNNKYKTIFFTKISNKAKIVKK